MEETLSDLIDRFDRIGSILTRIQSTGAQYSEYYTAKAFRLKAIQMELLDKMLKLEVDNAIRSTEK